MNNVLYDIDQSETDKMNYDQDYHLRTPLHVASCYNNISAAQFILNQSNSYIDIRFKKR